MAPDSLSVNQYLTNVKSSDASLPSRVADQITQLIIERQLASDDQLPNEYALAALLNVGRGTIREAVKLLVARNVLVIRRGKGTFIAKHPGEIDDPLGFAYYPNQLQVAMDLIEVRRHIEPWVAGIAAVRATDENLQEMQRHCNEVEQDILSGRNHLTKDTHFHVSIAQCTQNLVVAKLIPIITYSVRLFGSLNGNILLSETILGHRSIAEALCRRDSAAAEAAMLAHLEQNQRELQNIAAHLQTYADTAPATYDASCQQASAVSPL